MKLKDLLNKMYDNYRFVTVVDNTNGDDYTINPHSYRDIVPDRLMEREISGWALFYDRISIVVG